MKRTRIVHTCDAPDCTFTHEIPKKDTAPGVGIWFRGNRTNFVDGKPLPEVYACTGEHLLPALRSVLEARKR